MREKALAKAREIWARTATPHSLRHLRISYQVIWNLFLLFIIFTVIGTAFAGGVGAGYFASLVKDEPVRPKEALAESIYNYEETSEIFFSENVYLGKLRTDIEREEVPLESVAEHLKNAVIATEDEYFYQHDGIVPKAILRAIYQEVSNSANQTGGSTLTQQLIKQQVLTNEVSFERKAKEILLALRLENFFEKEEILEVYLNVSPFGRNSSGRNIAGVQAASQGIFGVNASELNLPQAAYIAGLPQSPFGYTPFTNKGERKENLKPSLNRQKVVLGRMLSNGFITEQQYKEALAYNIANDFIPKRAAAFDHYPALTIEVEKRAVKIVSKHLALKDGITEEEYNKSDLLQKEYTEEANTAIRQNGYRIHTTIDKDIYDSMDQAKDAYQNYGYSKNETVINPETGQTETVEEPVETGAMLIENKTGKILSFVGGRDFSREETNHATSPRPTGSTIKPLLVYAPAIELGKLAPGSLTLDAPISIPIPGQKAYSPNNFGNSFSGLTSARNALKKSQNIPAVTFYMEILNQEPLNYLRKMGVSTIRDSDYGLPALALSGPTEGISVEENANAYATLANEGKFVDAYMIEKIETKKGELIYQHKADAVQVFSPQTAYMTIDMMRDVVKSGTAASVRNRLDFSSDFAGKTGTSQTYRDSWFVASNPNVTLGVWTGYDTPKSLNYRYNGLDYSRRNIYLWADLMNAAYEADQEKIQTQKRFAQPEGLVTRSYCSILNLSSDICSKAGIGPDLFPANFNLQIPKNAASSGRFVSIGNKRYLALPSTPDEFIEQGSILSGEFLSLIGGKYVSKQYLSGLGLGLGNSASPLNDNGRAPYTVHISLYGNTIRWNAHGDGDVIGYRVYEGNRQVGIMKAGGSLFYNAVPGTYTVRAVDIAGNESNPSNAVTILSAEPAVPAGPPPAETPETDTETKPPAA